MEGSREQECEAGVVGRSKGVEATDHRKRCPICLDTIARENEAFLDHCFHKFCYHCILQWSEMVISHLVDGPILSLECPLCKNHYTSIIHNLHGQKFQRHYIISSGSRSAGFFMTQAHLQRQAVYSTQQGELSGNLESSAPVGCTSGDALENRVVRSHGTIDVIARFSRNQWLHGWLQRELQALLEEEDVNMLVHHVMGILESYGSRSKSANDHKKKKETVVDWQTSVSTAVQPFLFENSRKFAEELEKFLVSGLDIVAFDELTAGVVLEDKDVANGKRGHAEYVDRHCGLNNVVRRKPCEKSPEGEDGWSRESDLKGVVSKDESHLKGDGDEVHEVYDSQDGTTLTDGCDIVREAGADANKRSTGRPKKSADKWKAGDRGIRGARDEHKGSEKHRQMYQSLERQRAGIQRHSIEVGMDTNYGARHSLGSKEHISDRTRKSRLASGQFQDMKGEVRDQSQDEYTKRVRSSSDSDSDSEGRSRGRCRDRSSCGTKTERRKRKITCTEYVKNHKEKSCLSAENDAKRPHKLCSKPSCCIGDEEMLSSEQGEGTSSTVHYDRGNMSEKENMLLHVKDAEKLDGRGLESDIKEIKLRQQALANLKKHLQGARKQGQESIQIPQELVQKDVAEIMSSSSKDVVTTAMDRVAKATQGQLDILALDSQAGPRRDDSDHRNASDSAQKHEDFSCTGIATAETDDSPLSMNKQQVSWVLNSATQGDIVSCQPGYDDTRGKIRRGFDTDVAEQHLARGIVGHEEKKIALQYLERNSAGGSLTIPSCDPTNPSITARTLGLRVVKRSWDSGGSYLAKQPLQCPTERTVEPLEGQIDYRNRIKQGLPFKGKTSIEEPGSYNSVDKIHYGHSSEGSMTRVVSLLPFKVKFPLGDVNDEEVNTSNQAATSRSEFVDAEFEPARDHMVTLPVRHNGQVPCAAISDAGHPCPDHKCADRSSLKIVSQGKSGNHATTSPVVDALAGNIHSGNQSLGDTAGRFKEKTMSVMRGGESVQVTYKVYIPPQAAARAARRKLQR